MLILETKFPDLRWVLSAAGFLAMLPVCYMIAWTPWNVRYFCLSFTLFGIVLALLVFGVPGEPRLQLSLGVVVIWSACLFTPPLWTATSFDLWNALFAREGVSLRQRDEMMPVYNDVLSLRANRAVRWFLVASENAWTLPFLEQPRMEWEITPQWTQVKARLAKPGPEDSYALILNEPLPKDLPVEIVKKYSLSMFIVWLRSTPPESPETK